MNKLTLVAAVSLATLGFAVPQASAWHCCKSCCCSCIKVNYAQPNAFSPFCPGVKSCCGLFRCHKCCYPACCVACPPPCAPPCGPACGPMHGGCMDGSCGAGPYVAPAAPSAAPGSIPSTMPPATNGNTGYTVPMPMPSAQAYPYPPMMGQMTGYPMVQPVGYPPSYGPMMMGAPYGAGFGGTTYGPAPAYWNANYRGY